MGGGCFYLQGPGVGAGGATVFFLGGQNFVPAIPQNEVLAKFFEEIGEKCGEILRNFSQIFVLQFPGKMAAKNFTKDPAHFPRCTKLSFFTAATLGASGPNKIPPQNMKLGGRFGYFLCVSARGREGGVRGAGRGWGRFFMDKSQQGGGLLGGWGRGGEGLRGCLRGLTIFLRGRNSLQVKARVGTNRFHAVSSFLGAQSSRSPKAGHPKAGRSDFRNQRFETDTEKTRKMRKVPLTPEKQGSEEIPKSKNAENAENAENADTKTRKTRKMRTRKRGKCGKCG